MRLVACQAVTALNGLMHIILCEGLFLGLMTFIAKVCARFLENRLIAGGVRVMAAQTIPVSHRLMEDITRCFLRIILVALIAEVFQRSHQQFVVRARMSWMTR